MTAKEDVDHDIRLCKIEFMCKAFDLHEKSNTTIGKLTYKTNLSELIDEYQHKIYYLLTGGIGYAYSEEYDESQELECEACFGINVKLYDYKTKTNKIIKVCKDCLDVL